MFGQAAIYADALSSDEDWKYPISVYKHYVLTHDMIVVMNLSENDDYA